jgi:tubulin beta
MANQILFIHVGERGLRLGARLWELIAAEHGIAPTGQWAESDAFPREHLGALFDEEGGRFLPRALLVDLDPASLAHVRASALASLFDTGAALVGDGGTGGSWAKGYHGAGQQLLERVAGAIAQKVAASSGLQGFVVVHGLDGGTGGGLGARIVEHLRAHYPDRITASFSVLPTSAHARGAAESFNATLSLGALAAKADLCFLADDDALGRIALQTMRGASPAIDELDHFAATAFAAVSASWCSPAGMSLRRMATVLCPYPEAGLLVLGHAPLVPRSSPHVRALNDRQLVDMMYTPDNLLVSADPRHARAFASLALFRGEVSKDEAHDGMRRHEQQSPRHVDWIADNVAARFLPAPAAGVAKSATLISSHIAVSEVLKALSSGHYDARRDGEAVAAFVRDGVGEEALDDADRQLTERIEWYEHMS